MVQAAEKTGVVFATNHYLRSAGSRCAIRDLVASGKVGKVLSSGVLHAVAMPVRAAGRIGQRQGVNFGDLP